MTPREVLVDAKKRIDWNRTGIRYWECALMRVKRASADEIEAARKILVDVWTPGTKASEAFDRAIASLTEDAT